MTLNEYTALVNARILDNTDEQILPTDVRAVLLALAARVYQHPVQLGTGQVRLREALVGGLTIALNVEEGAFQSVAVNLQAGTTYTIGPLDGVNIAPDDRLRVSYTQGGAQQTATLIQEGSGTILTLTPTEPIFLLRFSCDIGPVTGTLPIGGTTQARLEISTDAGVTYRPLEEVAGSTGGTGDVDYSRTQPITNPFGALVNGYVPDGTVQDLLDDALYSYQAPGLTSFEVRRGALLSAPGPAQNGVLGVGVIPTIVAFGTRLVADTYSFLWQTSNPANVQPNTVRLQAGGAIIASNLPNTGSAELARPAFAFSPSNDRITWQVRITNTQGGTAQREYSSRAFPAVYAGVAAMTEAGDITPGFIRGLTRTLRATHLESISGNIGAGQRIYYAYPMSLGLRQLNTPLGALGGSLILQNIEIPTAEQAAAGVPGQLYAICRNDQPNLGNVTFTLTTL